jgi:hypothetical protein
VPARPTLVLDQYAIPYQQTNGYRICAPKLELFSGAILNGSSIATAVNFESPQGRTPPVQMNPGAYVRFKNAPLLGIFCNSGATLCIIGFLMAYDSQEEYEAAIRFSETDMTGLFSFSTMHVARPAWYDRNPSDTVKNSIMWGQSPHSFTTRWTYTVPTARKAMVEVAIIKFCRVTAATTAGELVIGIYITPSGGSLTNLIYSSSILNIVGDKDVIDTGQSVLLLTGDALSAGDSDASTGGTADFYQAAKVTEFDA